MGTYSSTEAVRAYLATYLPAELTAQSLPAMLEYAYGMPILAPLVKLPRLYVDCESWRQEHQEWDGSNEVGRWYTLGITAGIDGTDPATVEAQIHKLGDAICKVIEAGKENIGGSGTYCWVRTCDFSPPVNRAHALAQFVYIRCEILQDRAEET